MIVHIDFRNKEVHFDEDTCLDEMASCMNNYFPTEQWGDFKFMIDARINTRPDIERYNTIS